MTNIALHIEYLLTKQDCVILPGWGAFISHHSRAFSFEDSCQFKRPNKHITFNQALDHNDGMLAHSIIRREGVTYEAANKQIADFVASLKKQIEVDGTVALGRIGCFKSNDESMVFEPYSNANACDYNFGLSDLNIKTLSQLMQTEVASANGQNDDTESTIIIPAWGKRFIQIAASIAVLLCMTFMLSTPLSYDSKADYAALNSPLKVHSATDNSLQHGNEANLTIALPSTEAPVAEKSVIATEVLPKAITTEKSEPKASEPAAKTTVEIPHNPDGIYYLIVSSFETRTQAEKFIAQHNDDLRILESDGRYRIYAAQSNSQKTLSSVAKHLQSRYPGCWILRL